MSDISFGHRLDRHLVKKGFSAGWPLLTLNIVTARRVLASPVATFAAKRQAKAILANSKWAAYIPEREGYRAFLPDQFPQLREIVTACRSIFSRREEALSDRNNSSKPYFFNILTTNDLNEYPVLLNFALSKVVTEIVTGYLGHVPRLHSIGLYYSAVNDTVAGSQIFHVDGDALTQIKCFVNIWEVESGGGGFTFLPKSGTPWAFRSGGLLKTLSDADVARAVPEEQQITALGPPGSGVFADTSRCLHQGSRSREHPRLAFQFQYVSRPDTLLAASPNRTVAGDHINVSRNSLAEIEFCNPNALLFVE